MIYPLTSTENWNLLDSRYIPVSIHARLYPIFADYSVVTCVIVWPFPESFWEKWSLFASCFLRPTKDWWKVSVWWKVIGEQKVYFLFFQRPEHYNQEVLSHSHLFTIAICGRNCSDMQHWSLSCDIQWPGNMFNRWHFYTLNTNWCNKSSPRSLTHWCSHLTCMLHHFSHSTMSNSEL